VARLTAIDLSKEYLHFSAAHFTIFSSTERERLHGHNFRVSARITAPVGDNGLCFNYQIFKDKLRELCVELDEYTLIPEASPFLDITIQGSYYNIEFNGEVMKLLRSDTQLLPVRNISVEELAYFFLSQLVEDPLVNDLNLQTVEIKVASGPEQWGNCVWDSASPYKLG